jgi:hypothetical protein
VLAAFIIRAMMIVKAARTSQTSVYFYQTTQRNNPEDSHFHACRCGKLKSYFEIFAFMKIKEKNIRRCIKTVMRKQIVLSCLFTKNVDRNHFNAYEADIVFGVD